MTVSRGEDGCLDAAIVMTNDQGDGCEETATGTFDGGDNTCYSFPCAGEPSGGSSICGFVEWEDPWGAGTPDSCYCIYTFSFHLDHLP